MNEGNTTESAVSASSQTLRVFLNYRREDSGGQAGRLFDGLVATSADTVVFRDVDRIAPGVDFVEVIDDALNSCDVLLALIGRRWGDVTDAHGRRRLDDEDDFVRLELEKALGRQDVRVIPVLIDGANMPLSTELPEGLRSLVRRQAFELSDRRWKYDLGMLVETLEQIARVKSDQARAELAVAELAEQERLEQERLQAERLEGERLEAERADEERRLAAERLARDRADAERLERERVEAERREAERHEAKRLEAERREAERLEAERRAAEKAEAARLESERRAAARREAEQRKLARRAERPTGARDRHRVLVLAAVAAAALVLGGIAVLALNDGGQPETRAVPQAGADRLGVLAGARQYSFPAARLVKNDKGDGLELVGVSGGTALHGALRLKGTEVRFTPDGGYDGPFRFSYTVRDADGDLAVANVTGRVKGPTAAQKELVALVPAGVRGSCIAGPEPTRVRCHVPGVGELVLNRFATKKAAEAWLRSFSRGTENACASGGETGQWNWPGSARRGLYWSCQRSPGQALFFWTYPSPDKPNAAAHVLGRSAKNLRTWFFEQARLPKLS